MSDAPRMGFLRYLRHRRRVGLLIASAVLLGLGFLFLFSAGRFVLPVVFGD